MLSRAFTKLKRSPRHGADEELKRSENTIFYEYEDGLVGFAEDLPLVEANGSSQSQSPPTMREVLRASAGVMGESSLGMTEKVVFQGGRICTAKRFRQVRVRRIEFGRRIVRMAQVSQKCEYLVPVTAYLYTKRIKFILYDYYPMGSLADLLTGGRKYSHTALDWNRRLNILINIARAIAFIHSVSPSHEGRMHMNVHGNIRSSNIMIDIDFTARLSDYGFVQLARRVEFSGNLPRGEQPDKGQDMYTEELSQKGDIFNFGIIVMDVLGGPGASLDHKNCIMEKKERIRDGSFEFFGLVKEEKERRQALQVLEIGLACTNKAAEERPSMEEILLDLLVLSCKHIL